MPSTDWDGREYAHVATLQHELGRRFVDDLVLEPSSSVLDVGCGDGVITRWIADRPETAAVLGIDPSPLMIREAETHPRDGVRFEVGDVTTYTAETPFDAAVSLNALHWVHDSATALRRLHAALRADGVLAVQMVAEGERPSIEDVATAVALDGPWRAEFEGFTAPHMHRTESAWHALAGAAGFVVEESTVRDLTWDFEDAEAFRAWCAVGFTPWTSRLGESDRAPYLAAVTDEYARLTGSDSLFRFLQLRMRARRV